MTTRIKNIVDKYRNSGNRILFCGCAPCQPFSTQNKKRFDSKDERINLLSEFLRFVEDCQPDFILCENVPGLQKIDKDGPLPNFINKLESMGYHVPVPQVVHAEDYGVPQERRRVFYIGFRNDLDIRFTFPIGSTADDKKKLTLRDVIWDLQFTAVPAGAKNYHNPQAINNNEYFTGAYSPIFMSRNRVKGWDEQAFTVQASGRQCQLHPQAPKMNFVEQNKREFVKGKEHLYRRMTIREVARIQGFPDDFKFIYNYTDDAYKMIGNAVPVNLAYEVAVAIKTALESAKEKTYE